MSGEEIKRNNAKKMTAMRCALLAMEETGRVIVGYKPWADLLSKGDILNDFAGRDLPGHELHITGRATREAWDAQVQLFGFVDPNEHTKGDKFYTAVLVERPK